MEYLLPRRRTFSDRKAVVVSIALAVVLPQAVHVLGIFSGSGNALGLALLPMHLAVFLVGLYAGAAAGFVVGAVSPMLSFALTGMPAFSAMPFMCLELASYGLICGLFSGKKVPTVFAVLLAQAGGRAIKFFCMLFILCALRGAADPMNVWTATLQGLPGICIQLCVVPLIIGKSNGFAK